MACAVVLARCLDVEPCCVDGSRGASGSFQGCFHVLCHLVESDDEDDAFRPPSDCRHPVASTVYVHQHSVLRDGVGARKIEVHIECFSINGEFLLLCLHFVTVEDLVAGSFKGSWQSKISHGHGAAPCHTASFRHQCLHLFNNVLGAVAIICFKMALLQVFDESCRQFFISNFLWIHISKSIIIISIHSIWFAKLAQKDNKSK